MVSKKAKYFNEGLQVTFFEVIYFKSALRQLLIFERISILLVNDGFISFEINHRKMSISRNDILVIPKRTIVEILTISNPLKICQLSFTSEFTFENSLKKPYIGYFEFFITKYPPALALKNKEFLRVIELFKLLDSKAKSSNKNLFKREGLLFSFNLLLYELAGIYNKYYHHIPVMHTGKEKLVLQFFSVLEINCRSQHHVQFYADALFITPGHLTKTVKVVTTKTAKQFIEEALILEIKIVLQNNELTIARIIEELQFPSASFFSSFFKKHTGLSPTEYRLRLNL
ncbi:helix-turn-helix domain-containing protein [Flavobacterium sp.]|uniref:helix-turn-helix domain-containing protein n=1 Tax=Flavobacterium sp. TaxID=239 RepID=UPI002634A17D|nr:helix-turn-helix domain-containing protein [Flavobacterium sp.]MDG2432875.1 helix-turn-helix domain-containing protein [Flavobacterium sp.]